MRLRRLVLLDFSEDDLAAQDWRVLGELAEVQLRTTFSDPELSEHLRVADALLVQMGVPVTRAMLDAAPELRYLGVFATSTAHIDAEAERRGIVVRNVPDYATEAVAELAIALALDHLRDVSSARARAARGDLSEPRALGRELRSLRVGVLGLGPIGRRVAQIARHGFGAEVLASSRTRRPDLDIPQAELEEVLARSELLFVHLALTAETRGLLDARRISRLPDGALVVLLSPPALFELPALLVRLEAGTLHLVTDHGDELSPGDAERLRSLPSVTLVPPIGYGTREAWDARRAGLLAAIRAFVGP